MNINDLKPENPGILFSVNDKNGFVQYFLTPHPIVAAPNFSPNDIAATIWQILTDNGFFDEFSKNPIGKTISDKQTKMIIEQLGHSIPDKGQFFMPLSDLQKFISDFLSGIPHKLKLKNLN